MQEQQRQKYKGNHIAHKIRIRRFTTNPLKKRNFISNVKLEEDKGYQCNAENGIIKVMIQPTVFNNGQNRPFIADMHGSEKNRLNVPRWQCKKRKNMFNWSPA